VLSILRRLVRTWAILAGFPGFDDYTQDALVLAA